MTPFVPSVHPCASLSSNMSLLLCVSTYSTAHAPPLYTLFLLHSACISSIAAVKHCSLGYPRQENAR